MYIAPTTEGLQELLELAKSPTLYEWTEAHDRRLLENKEKSRMALRCFLGINHINVRDFAKTSKVTYQTAVNYLTGITKYHLDRTIIRLFHTMTGRLMLIQEDLRRAQCA